MKIKRIVLILVAFVTVFGFSSCKSKFSYSDKTKVTYILEGGTFKNCTAPILQYYDVDKGQSILIHDPSVFNENKGPTKESYDFDGWYKTKKQNGEEVVYEDRWDFEKDKITQDGITLYAGWKKPSNYIYNVCYYDEEGNIQSLGTYPVQAGDKFEDYQSFRNRRSGYTAVDFCDENGNPWDENFVHPGGEGTVEIKVFVNYILGNYAIVRTATDLTLNSNRNIYLMNDIDMKGAQFNFNNYNHIFEGNNHTIRNFNIGYDATRNGLTPNFEDGLSNDAIRISIFGDIKNATIRNVNFENVHVMINFGLSTIRYGYVTGICTSITNSIVDNVHFTGDYTIVKLSSKFDVNNLFVAVDEFYFAIDDTSTVTNVSCKMTKLEN